MKLNKTAKNIILYLTAAVILISSLSLQTFAVGGSSAKEKVYELKTSCNPEYYADIKIKGQSITVNGCIKSQKVSEVVLINSSEISATFRTGSDGTFSAVLNPSKPETDNAYGYIAIVLENGANMKYRIEYDNGWYFPDNKLSEENEDALDNIVVTQPKVWASYTSDDLSPESVNDTLDEIRYLSEYIAGDISGDYNKTVAIARWVSENIYYDRDARDTSVTEATICLKNVLRTKRTVCGGYANLFCALCQAQGIRAVSIRGTAAAGGVTYETLGNSRINHEWCAVNINGKWINVDVCWNSGNKYENGEYTKNICYEKYTDPSPLALSFDHCAFVAEERLFFRAHEYFEQQNQTVQTTVSTDVSVPEASGTQTASVGESSAVPSTSSRQDVTQSSSQASENSSESIDGNMLTSILIIGAIAIAVLICVIVYNIISARKSG